MGWMHQAGGSCKRELVGVVERILKGPCRLGASLALGWVVLMLEPSSQTSWPGENVCDGIPGPLRFITSAVTNLFVTGARDRENARDQVALTSHVTVGTHVTYHVTSGPLGYHVTYHVTHHVIQLV